MSEAQQRMLAVGVAVALAMLGAVQLAGPMNLGLPPQAAVWLGIVSAGLGVLATFLPRVVPGGSPRLDPPAG